MSLSVTLVLACLAQDPVTVIYLSNADAARAKQAADNVRAQAARKSGASAAWEEFHSRYQAAHPELRPVRFSSDFKIAFALKSPTITSRDKPDVPVETGIIELSAVEQREAARLYREMREARQAFDQARKAWLDFQYELVAAHIRTPSTGYRTTVTLPDGKTLLLPNEWLNVAFAPDFRVAVPAFGIAAPAQ